jgi:hypothetical protein
MTSRPVCDCHQLMDRYEELRLEAIGRGSFSGSGQGLALVVRKGLTAWMEAWSRCASPVDAVHRHISAMGARPAVGVRTELVQVLATMTLEHVAARCGRTY